MSAAGVVVPPGHLDPAARRREASLMMACLLDSGLLAAYLVIGIWAGSLTVIADGTRGGLMLVMECVLLVMMRRIHRGRLSAYDYGAGKLEQALNLLIATAMGVSGVYLSFTAITRWFRPVEQSAEGLEIAALLCLANVGLNAWALRSMWLAGRDGTSIIMTGQIRARVVKVVSSVVVLATVTTTALAVGWPAAPGWLAPLAETVGTTFIGLVMVQFCFSMWSGALPQLLDRTLDEARQNSINRALALHFNDFDALLAVRSRIIGQRAIVEIELGFDPGRRMGDIQRVADSIADHVRNLIAGAQVTIIPVSTAPPAPILKEAP